MKIKIDFYLFILSLLILIFYPSLSFLTRFIYILPIAIITLVLISRHSLFDLHKFINLKLGAIHPKNFTLIISFLIFIVLSALIGKYDLLKIKTYVEGSEKKFINLISNKNINNAKELYNPYNPDNKKINIKNFLDNEKFVILTKLDSDQVRLLNNKFEDIKSFSITSKKFKDAIPFYILPNGELIASKSWWFSSSGLSKFDNNFNEIWNIDNEVHHFASVHKEKLYVPSFKTLSWAEFKKSEIFNKYKNFNCNDNAKKFLGKEMYDVYKKEEAFLPLNYDENKQIRQDEILTIDLSSGEILKKINILELLSNDEHFLNIIHSSKDSRCWDLLHLNDVVRIDKNLLLNFLPDEINSTTQNISEEIYLISLRDINTLLILDLETSKVIWSVTNLTHNQHSPRMLANGNILLFDNFNYEHDGSTKGFSALKEISIKNKKIISVYSGNNTIHLSSKRRGRLQVVGNKIFTLASDQKKFLEIECKQKKEKFLNNCKIKELYSIDDDNFESIFMSDIYLKDNNGFKLYE